MWIYKHYKIEKTTVPVIAKLKDNSYLLLVNRQGEKWIILDPVKGKPETIDETSLFEKLSGKIIVIGKKKSASEDDGTRKFGFSWFIPTILKFKKQFICVLIAVFVIQILGILTPLMTQVVVDKILSHHAMNTLYTIAIGIAIVYIYELIISLCKSYLFVHTTNRIDVTLSSKLFHHLFGLPLKYFESRRVGETVARVRKLDQIRSFLTGTPLSSMIDVFFVIVYIVVLFLYDVPLTCIVIASLPMFAILSLIIMPLFKKSLDEKFVTGAKAVIAGTLSIGQLVAFRMLAGRVSGPVLRLVQLWQEYQQASLSVKRIGDIFNSPMERKSSNSIKKLPMLKGKIRFENVRFRYRMDSSDVLQGISFEIKENKVIGLVGRSGSGKSTISKLIQRLYIPQSGRISIDGMDVSLMDPQMLRKQIGVVLQENFMFNGTVAENISIHCPDVTIDKIMETAKIAGAHDFIMELEEGYDTIIGEKGVSLSGGQKQRIAIARAIINDPRILIFDEATSALDYESESIIQKNLKDICKNRTVLIIAHRLSTLSTADEIMVIDRGELKESGSHDELMKKDGLYAYLYNQQLRGEVE